MKNVSNAAKIAIAAFVCAIAVFLVFAGSIVEVLNSENHLANVINAKQKDNKSEMDAMWKTIEQTAQVSKAHKDSLIEIFNGYASARTGNGKGGSLANWIKEAVPNVDLSTFNNLQNIISAKRDGFAQRQKELLGLSSAHNDIIGGVWSGFVCKVFGRHAINVTIVTSTRTENAFETGKDDSTVLPLK